MKYIFLVIISFFSIAIIAQDVDDSNLIEVNSFRGNVLRHSPDIGHLITGHPQGTMISFLKKTHGKDSWHQLYNYPDYGIYFLHQDFKNPILGKNYAIGGQYNFYFLNRMLVFKIAEGVAMTTNPQDKETNNKNKAFGSKIMANTDLAINFKKENLIGNFGVQAGFFFTHFSNGKIKSPNSGINTYNFNVGLNYNFDKKQNKVDSTFSLKYTQPIKYNFVLRTGVNESPVIGSGQKPFYHIGFYLDKRINKKSALQLGTELFLTTSNIEYIKYRSIAFPEKGIPIDTDYKRVGVFIGHELFINRLSIEAQMGYYVYQPFKADLSVYNRLGAKYYLTEKVFVGGTIKTHSFLAEALEFAIGMRL